jgi:3-hydroxybutyryl-CoA dehydrogenase
MKIGSVAVFGAGRMGTTIAISLACAGMKVKLVSRANVDKALFLVKQRLTRQQENGEITRHENKSILGNIEVTTEVEKAGDAQLVIETIVEDMRAKKRLFRRLDALCPAYTIFASNTSSLSIAELSKATKRKNRFLGLHFFYPADKMKLLEIVTTPAVDRETINSIQSWATQIMKETVVVDDSAGFIVNRLIFPVINEAIDMVEKKTASPGEIDKAMQLGLNWPTGPLSLADIIGLDVCLRITRSLYARIGEKKYQPGALLVRKVRNGHLGKKTKRGFYNY